MVYNYVISTNKHDDDMFIYVSMKMRSLL